MDPIEVVDDIIKRFDDIFSELDNYEHCRTPSIVLRGITIKLYNIDVLASSKSTSSEIINLWLYTNISLKLSELINSYASNTLSRRYNYYINQFVLFITGAKNPSIKDYFLPYYLNLFTLFKPDHEYSKYYFKKNNSDIILDTLVRQELNYIKKINNINNELSELKNKLS